MFKNETFRYSNFSGRAGWTWLTLLLHTIIILEEKLLFSQ